MHRHRPGKGIAVSSGTDIVFEVGDFTLSRNDPGSVVTALNVARRNIFIIHGNLFRQFNYNILLMPIGSGMFEPAYGLHMNPMVARPPIGLCVRLWVQQPVAELIAGSIIVIDKPISARRNARSRTR